jgi:GxxExxY protein
MVNIEVVNNITEKIIGCAIAVHRELGPGLLESAYEACLEFELTQSGLFVQRQVSLPLNYKGLHVDAGFRIDLFVENLVVLELKSVEKLEKIHEAQLHTYLRLMKLRVGLLMNFNTVRMIDGIKRIIRD